MNKLVFFIFIALFLGLTVWFFFSPAAADRRSLSPWPSGETHEKFWEYQCIDTMKTSRDKAREWREWSGLDTHINSQMKAIVAAGGNCVAIDTPYDNEFLPFMRKWVTAARKHNLHIWFRGNFSSWEGWFDYPKGMTTAEHLRKTTAFITTNRDLFMDGDIFTPSPEAENGGPFNQVEKDEYPVFRAYLISEYQEAQKAFRQIGRDVAVNWLSMNGGLARRMLDQQTIDALGGVVAIDHYIKTALEMGEYIRYFNNTFGAKVVIGEWGAPIPDINGSMTENQQADFIRQLLEEQRMNKDIIEGTSYWVLYDGSTALINQDGTARPVIEAVKDYFRPATLTGQVKDNAGNPLENVRVEVEGSATQTNSDGIYEILSPSSVVTIHVNHKDYIGITKKLRLKRDKKYTQHFALKPLNSTWWHQLQQRINKIFR